MVDNGFSFDLRKREFFGSERSADTNRLWIYWLSQEDIKDKQSIFDWLFEKYLSGPSSEISGKLVKDREGP